MTELQWLDVMRSASHLRRKVILATDGASGMRWAWMAVNNPFCADWIEYVPEAKDQCR